MLWRPHTQTWAFSPVSLSTFLNAVSYKHWLKRSRAVCAIPHQESYKGQTKFIDSNSQFTKTSIPWRHSVWMHYCFQCAQRETTIQIGREKFSKSEDRYSSTSAPHLFYLFSQEKKTMLHYAWKLSDEMELGSGTPESKTSSNNLYSRANR